MELTSDIETRVERSGEAHIVYVEGEIRLPGAGDLQRVLATTLKVGRRVVLDLAGATVIDLAGLQLLCSAHRTSRAGPSPFELRAAPERLRNTARAAGFDARTLVCPYRRDGACLWKD